MAHAVATLFFTQRVHVDSQNDTTELHSPSLVTLALRLLSDRHILVSRVHDVII